MIKENKVAVYSGPETSELNLQLALDLSNARKNSTANIFGNLIQNGNFSGGSGSSQESGSVATNTIIQFDNPGDSPYVLRQNGNFAEYQINISSGISSSTTYVMSGWYAKSADYADSDTMFYAAAYSLSGNNVSTPNTGIGTLIYSTVINNITWEYRYQTITTPSDSNGNISWFVGYGVNNTSGYRYYTNLKLEEGTYPKLYNLITSGNTGNGKCENSPSFGSTYGGFLTFDGTDDWVDCPLNLTGSGSWTMETWFRVNGSPSNPSFMNVIVDTCPSGSTANMIHVDYGGNYGGSQNQLVYSSRPAGGSYTHLTGPVLSQSVWYHVCVCRNYSLSGGSTQLYVNGVLNNVYNGNISTGSTSPVRIGRWTDGTTYARVSVGMVKIYNRFLPAEEVQQNFNATRGRFGI